MSIKENRLPIYHETFTPILKVLAKNGEMKSNDLKNEVIKEYYSHLPEELLKKRTKNNYLMIVTRIHFGAVTLKTAKMIERPARGAIGLTDKGKRVIKSQKSFTISDLKNDKDYLKYREVRLQKQRESQNDETTKLVSSESKVDDDPMTKMLDAEDELRNHVQEQILERLLDIDPYKFEEIVLKLFKNMGYGDFEITSKSNDGGIDGILKRDALDFDRIYVQAKRYKLESGINEKEMRDFIGAMSVNKADKGIFVTTSHFAGKAKSAADSATSNSQKIKLISGLELTSFMLEYNCGVQVSSSHEIKAIDLDFFEGDEV